MKKIGNRWIVSIIRFTTLIGLNFRRRNKPKDGHWRLKIN